MSLPTSIHPFLVTGNDANQYKVPYSLRFRNDGNNGAKLVRTFQNAGNRKTWTWSVWLKIGRQAQADSFLFAYNSGGGYNRTYHEFLNGTITIGDYTTGYVWQVATTQVIRDYAAWYHYVVQFDTTQATAANRVRLYLNGSQITALATASYPSLNYDAYINQAAEHVIGSIGYANNSGFDGYMAEMYFIDGYAYDPSYFGYTDRITNQWHPKKYTGAYGTNGFYLPFKDNTTATSENKLTYSEQFNDASWAKPAAPVAPTVTANAIAAPNGTVTADRLEFSGPTAHPVYKESSFTITNGSTVTTSVYLKNYIAGSYNLQCFIFTPTNLDSYTNIVFDSNGVLTSCTPVGGDAANTTAEFYDIGNGWYRVVCMHTNNSGSSEGGCRFSVGQNGNSGASGIYAWGAQMELSSTVGPYWSTTSSVGVSTYRIGRDASNGDASWNNWVGYSMLFYSPANTTTFLHDSYIDTPTNYEDGSTYYNKSNYATLNPLSNINTTLNSGNLYQYYAGSWSSALATIGVTSGKWYMEAYAVAVVATNYTIVGVALQPWTTSTYLGGSATSYGFQWNGATSYKYINNNGGVTVSTPGGTLAAGGILQLAFDANTGNVWYGLNNTWAEGSPSAGTGASHTVSPTPATGVVWHMGIGQYGGNACGVNFGQRPFVYTPPTGFKALNTYNLPNPSLPLV